MEDLILHHKQPCKNRQYLNTGHPGLAAFTDILRNIKVLLYCTYATLHKGDIMQVEKLKK